MPLNSRYLKGPYSSTSTLYKQAKAAENKINSINDSEMKYYFDTNQISGEQYLSYANKRKEDARKANDELETIAWDRSIISINRSMRADMRRQGMLALSQIPENSSSKIAQKLKLLDTLWQDASADGDQDAAISIETQYNNTWNSYNNKLEQEARNGQRAAQKELNRIYTEQKTQIDYQRSVLNNGYKDENGVFHPPITDPLAKANASANLDIQEYNALLSKYQGTDDPEVAAGMLDTLNKLETRAINNASMLEGDPIKDASGRTIGFNAQKVVDARGNTDYIANQKEGWAKLYGDNGTYKLVNTNQKLEKTPQIDPEGNIYWTVQNSSLDPEKTVTMTNPETGEKYFSTIKEIDDSSKTMDANGVVTNKGATKKVAVVPDSNGHYMMYNEAMTKETGQKVFDRPFNPLDISGEAQKELLQARTQPGAQNLQERINPITGQYENPASMMQAPYKIPETGQYQKDAATKWLGSMENYEGLLRTPTNVKPAPNEGFLGTTKNILEGSAMGVAGIPRQNASRVNLGAKIVTAVQNPFNPQNVLNFIPQNIKNTATNTVKNTVKSSIGKVMKFSDSLMRRAPGIKQPAPLMIRPNGGQLIGSKNGINYFRVAKPGGWDFYKGKDFKLSVNDVAKEVLGDKNRTQNYLNKNWKL